MWSFTLDQGAYHSHYTDWCVNITSSCVLYYTIIQFVIIQRGCQRFNTFLGVILHFNFKCRNSWGRRSSPFDDLMGRYPSVYFPNYSLTHHKNISFVLIMIPEDNLMLQWGSPKGLVATARVWSLTHEVTILTLPLIQDQLLQHKIHNYNSFCKRQIKMKFTQIRDRVRNAANRTKHAYFTICHSHWQYLRDVFLLQYFNIYIVCVLFSSFCESELKSM